MTTIAVWTACDVDLDAVLTQLMDARRVTADMRVQLHRSAGAVQRAIMADADEVSGEFAREAEEANAALEADLRSVEPVLAELDYREETRLLQDFASAFAKLRALDRTLLALAVGNTNVKAQQLAFGPAREAVDGLRDRLAGAVRSAPAPNALRAELLAARAELAVRSIQALQAPHIAEPDDAVMTELEERMAASEAAARASLAELSQLLGPAAGQELAGALEQLDRFAGIHQELVALSRQNTDVRSLAVALGEKRTLTASCDAALIALQEALAKRGFQATR